MYDKKNNSMCVWGFLENAWNTEIQALNMLVIWKSKDGIILYF